MDVEPWDGQSVSRPIRNAARRRERATDGGRGMWTGCATWTPGPDLPAAVVTAAREVLRAAGQTPLVDGWEEWDGDPPLL